MLDVESDHSSKALRPIEARWTRCRTKPSRGCCQDKRNRPFPRPVNVDVDGRGKLFLRNICHIRTTAVISSAPRMSFWLIKNPASHRSSVQPKTLSRNRSQAPSVLLFACIISCNPSLLSLTPRTPMLCITQERLHPSAFPVTHETTSRSWWSGSVTSRSCRRHAPSWVSLPGNSSREYLCSEEATLCALNDLLVDTDGWVVHDDGAGFVVDLSIDTSVADQVDDPLLSLSMRQA